MKKLILFLSTLLFLSFSQAEECGDFFLKAKYCIDNVLEEACQEDTYADSKKCFLKGSLTFENMLYPDMRQLFFDESINSKSLDQYRSEALASASFNCDVKLMKRLIETGANVNVADNSGSTSLIWAAVNLDGRIVGESKCYKAVKYLLKKGADINAKDNYGETALHKAAYNHDLRMIKLLLKKGASPDLRDKDGRDPIQVIYDSQGYNKSNGFIDSESEEAIKVINFYRDGGVYSK